MTKRDRLVDSPLVIFTANAWIRSMCQQHLDCLGMSVRCRLDQRRCSRSELVRQRTQLQERKNGIGVAKRSCEMKRRRASNAVICRPCSPPEIGVQCHPTATENPLQERNLPGWNLDLGSNAIRIGPRQPIRRATPRMV